MDMNNNVDKDDEDMRNVNRLIKNHAKCPAPHCSRLMANWYGCESPDCPVPLKVQAQGFVSF